MCSTLAWGVTVCISNIQAVQFNLLRSLDTSTVDRVVFQAENRDLSRAGLLASASLPKLRRLCMFSVDGSIVPRVLPSEMVLIPLR